MALPLINTTYDLNDAAYHADIIEQYSADKGHKQIADINPKNSKNLKNQIEGEKILIKLGFNTSRSNHYKHRSSIERLNGYLKDNFGCKNI